MPTSRIDSNMTQVILETIPQLVSVVDADLKYLFANEAYYKWFGLTVEQVIGRSMSDVLGNAAVEKARDYIDRVLSGEKLAFETVISYKLLGERNIQVSYTPLVNTEFGATCFLAVVSDLTETKFAEASLRKVTVQLHDKDVEYEHLYQMLPIGIVTMDIHLKITSTNSTFSQMLGYLEAEMIGNSILKFTHPEDKPASINFRSEQLGRDRLSGRIRKRYIAKNGDIIWAKVTNIKVPKANSEASDFFIATVEDITNEKALSDQLEDQKLKVAESARLAALGEMSAGVAHEINNPLAIISGKLNSVLRMIEKDEPDFCEMRASIERVKSAADRIAKIVNGLRSFSQGTELDTPSLVSISNLLQDTLSFCAERFRSKGIALGIVISSDIKIECRTVQISQVFLNLLNNAFDAVVGSSDPWVKIEVLGNADSIKIRISDSGLGIAPDVVQKLMHPFFTTKGVGKGTGLGLSISKGIVESHGGTLSYVSDSKNTCFEVTLPLVQSRGSTSGPEVV